MEKQEIFECSENIYADLGFANAEEDLAKSRLSIEIFRIMKKRKLTEKKTAKILSITPTELSAVLKGKLQDFSIDSLFRFLLLLGADIEVKINTSKQSRIHVSITD